LVWVWGRTLHVGQVAGHDEAVVADECFSRGDDALLACRGQGDIRHARVSAVEGPFGFAVADDEDAGVGHCGNESSRGLQGVEKGTATT
jgi:hypothetical protein